MTETTEQSETVVNDYRGQEKNISNLGVIYVTGCGAEVPSQPLEDGTIGFIRDANGGIGIMLVLAGDAHLAGIESDIAAVTITAQNIVQRYMFNPNTAGRVIALLHELSYVTGTQDEMHASLDRNRADLKEKLAGIDLSHLK